MGASDTGRPRRCLSCAIVSGEIQPAGGTILASGAFHVRQDVADSVPGMVILVVENPQAALMDG